MASLFQLNTKKKDKKKIHKIILITIKGTFYTTLTRLCVKSLACERIFVYFYQLAACTAYTQITQPVKRDVGHRISVSINVRMRS